MLLCADGRAKWLREELSAMWSFMKGPHIVSKRKTKGEQSYKEPLLLRSLWDIALVGNSHSKRSNKTVISAIKGRTSAHLGSIRASMGLCTLSCSRILPGCGARDLSLPLNGPAVKPSLSPSYWSMITAGGAERVMVWAGFVIIVTPNNRDEGLQLAITV